MGIGYLRDSKEFLLSAVDYLDSPPSERLDRMHIKVQEEPSGGDIVNFKLKHVRREKSGLLFYRRGIPADLQKHYGGKRFIVESLKTHDPERAAIKVAQLATRDDAYWKKLRENR
jgi:hypothetical protein